MPVITPEDIKRAIEAGLACEHVEVDGDGRHFQAVIVSEAFAGLSKVRQHQLVYGALGDRMREEIHALSMQTLTPAQWRPRLPPTGRASGDGQAGDHRRRRAARRGAGFRRQERGVADPLRRAADLRASGAQQRAQLNDVRTMRSLLTQMGVRAEGDDGALTLSAAAIDWPLAPYEMVKTMRASILALGPLLARCGEARVSLPGGCAIGLRPVDQHIKGLQAMGAEIDLEHGYIDAKAKRLSRRQFRLRHGDGDRHRKPDDGRDARDRHDGARQCGARARGRRPRRLPERDGREDHRRGHRPHRDRRRARLSGATHTIMPDRIETGTFLVAAAATGGDVTLTGARPDTLERGARQAARSRRAPDDRAAARSAIKRNGALRSVSCAPLPYPGFPTDMQAQFMALMTVADGTAMITETIFENRFMHVQELKRLGAEIEVEGNTAIVRGAQS